MASRITKEWRLPVGKTPDGTQEWRVIGHEIEDDFGGGNKTTRLRLCMDILQPVLYQQAKSQAVAGSSYAYCERADFAKRYKDPSAPPVEVAGPGEEGPEDDGGRD